MTGDDIDREKFLGEGYLCHAPWREVHSAIWILAETFGRIPIHFEGNPNSACSCHHCLDVRPSQQEPPPDFSFVTAGHSYSFGNQNILILLMAWLKVPKEQRLAKTYSDGQ